MKLLSIDLETSPNVGYHWGLWQQNISPMTQLIEPSRMLCFAAKWMDSDEMLFYSEHRDRSEMIQAAHDLMHEADVIMHYNGDKFDLPKLRQEILMAGLKPPSPSKSIDLMKVVKRQFKFQSNKLDFVATQLGLGGKVKHSGFDLWKRCLDGDAEAWSEMEEYNRQDVYLLEELYDILRPWVPSHPHMGLYSTSDEDVCPNCASANLRREGHALTALGKYQRFVCRDCGKWSRSSRRVSGVGIQSAL